MYLRAILASSLFTVSVAAQQSAWVDPSPHKQRLVQVDPNASVEVLDWGGSGRAIVLLAQMGQTAHIYDDWAPKLARTYHVLGITRRGFGESIASAAAVYSMERIATDIVTAMDSEKVQAPILIGNGFAGEEISWIGARLPNHVAGLIYLDAAYDRSNLGAEGSAIARRIPPPRPPQPQDFESAQSLTRLMSRGIGFPIPESETRQLIRFGQDGRVAGERTPVTVRQQILAGMVKADYASIHVPALGIYAKPTSSNSLPGCQATDDQAVREACRELLAWTLRHLRDSERLFRTIRSKVQIIELPGANSPFVFLSNEREVMHRMDQFVSTLAR